MSCSLDTTLGADGGGCNSSLVIAPAVTCCRCEPADGGAPLPDPSEVRSNDSPSRMACHNSCSFAAQSGGGAGVSTPTSNTDLVSPLAAGCQLGQQPGSCIVHYRRDPQQPATTHRPNRRRPDNRRATWRRHTTGLHRSVTTRLYGSAESGRPSGGVNGGAGLADADGSQLVASREQ